MKDVLRLREYWNGDFTALTPPSDSKADWSAYTLRLPEADRGVILAFRREDAPDCFAVKLPEIHPDKPYALTLSDENLVETRKVVSGKILAEGFPVTVSQTPGSVVIFYQAIDP